MTEISHRYNIKATAVYIHFHEVEYVELASDMTGSKLTISQQCLDKQASHLTVSPIVDRHAKSIILHNTRND
jgi:hypothetical protein